MEIDQVNNSQVLLNREVAKVAHVFSSSLQGFNNDAISARRGFQVAMAVNVFGVGTLLPNTLTEQRLARADRPSLDH